MVHLPFHLYPREKSTPSFPSRFPLEGYGRGGEILEGKLMVDFSPGGECINLKGKLEVNFPPRNIFPFKKDLLNQKYHPLLKKNISVFTKFGYMLIMWYLSLPSPPHLYTVSKTMLIFLTSLTYIMCT